MKPPWDGRSLVPFYQGFTHSYLKPSKSRWSAKRAGPIGPHPREPAKLRRAAEAVDRLAEEAQARIIFFSPGWRGPFSRGHFQFHSFQGFCAETLKKLVVSGFTLNFHDLLLVASPFGTQGSESFQKTIRTGEAAIGFCKERWLKRMGDQPLEVFDFRLSHKQNRFG